MMKGLWKDESVRATPSYVRRGGHLITVFRDNYPPARPRALFIPCAPLALCRSSSLVDRFLRTHARARRACFGASIYSGENIRETRGKERKRKRKRVRKGERKRSGRRYAPSRALARVGATGCVHPGDGCKQSRRCSLCNANT